VAYGKKQASAFADEKHIEVVRRRERFAQRIFHRS